jgi:hypothetical protein
MRALPIERLAFLPAVFLLALVSPAATLRAAALAQGDACGDQPLPSCPLNAWMKANMSPAVLSSDFDALAVAFEKAATFAPAAYQNWSSIAKDGADAARAQSLDGVKGACRGCHAQYRDRYKKEMRDRPL